MEKNHRIVIIGLVIVIIALAAGIAYMVMGNNLLGSGGGNAPDGMKIYDFNSVFKMAVPKNSKFLKEWGEINDFGEGYSYLDKDNEFCIAYIDSPIITHEAVKAMAEASKNSGNSTFEFDGDLMIRHNVKANGKAGDSYHDCNYTQSIVLQKGHQMVVVSGNNLDLIKSMIKTIEFYQ